MNAAKIASSLGVAERLLVYAGDREVSGQGSPRAMPLSDAIARLAAIDTR
ncbi:MAG: hypothetical protein KUG58_09865 [Marinosulfonomonas sp.]|nr:hypothetical protein [Marinosulfonomonas sp.]